MWRPARATDVTFGFNTAVSQMMILVNDTYKHNLRPKSLLKTLAQLLQPFAPHFAEEIWEHMGGKGLVSVASWPTYDPKLIVDDTVEMGVQNLVFEGCRIKTSKSSVLRLERDQYEPWRNIPSGAVIDCELTGPADLRLFHTDRKTFTVE